MTVEVTDNPGLERYEAHLDGELIGFAQYNLEGPRMTIFHTEIDHASEGQGYGSQLARAALEDVRRRGLELVPRCSFIAAYVRRHPDLYLETVAEPLRAGLMARG